MFSNISDLLDNIFCADSKVFMSKLPDSFVDLVLTDPPYFFEKLDNNWQPEAVVSNTKGQVVRNLVGGMKFDKKQSYRLYDWFFSISLEIYRVLKPGSFFFLLF